MISRSTLNVDLREIGKGSFPDNLNNSKSKCLPGNIVVQVQKVRNISALRANEESRAAPRMLKVSLTDGITTCQAIEICSIPYLSLNTAPGTKLYLRGDSIPMVNGIILLRPDNVEVLGGNVVKMTNTWKLNKYMAKLARERIRHDSGPPPWISFNEQFTSNLCMRDVNSKPLKMNLQKDTKLPAHTEFETQRNFAIADAVRGSRKKVFGGGTLNLLDHNVQQLVDYGFQVDQAVQALNITHDNVGRALHILQHRASGENEEYNGSIKYFHNKRREHQKGTGNQRTEKNQLAKKPIDKFQLCDFLHHNNLLPKF